MIFKKGHIICQSDYGLELRKVVEEFLEISDMSKRCLNQYISLGRDVLDLKEHIATKSQASGFFYYISIGRFFDYRSLKRLTVELNSSREGLEIKIFSLEICDSNGLAILLLTLIFPIVILEI